MVGSILCLGVYTIIHSFTPEEPKRFNEFLVLPQLLDHTQLGGPITRLQEVVGLDALLRGLGHVAYTYT